MKNRQIKLAAASATVVVGLVVIGLTVHSLSQPSKGLVTYNAADTVQAVSNTLQFKTFSSPLISFSYPSSMSSYPASKPVLPTLASYSFISRGENSWFLAVSVIDSPGENFSDNSAYVYRENNPKIYRASKLTINGLAVTVMTDVIDPGYDKVAFIDNSSYQATVALTANDSADPSLSTAFNTILSSWQWH